MEAPSTLTNTIKNGNDIVLSWSSVKYAEKYNVYQINADGQKTLVSSATGLTYTITNSPAGTYNYAVSTVNSLYGESLISNSLQISVVFPVMGAPSNLTYKIQNVNDVVLTWGAVSYANNYKVYELIDGEEVLKTTVSSTTATLSNVQAGNHTYVVHSISTRFGESTVGSQISLTMNQVTMQAPANLTYSLTNGTDITLKWGTVTYATAYKIYQIIDGQKVLKSTITGTTITYSTMPYGNYIYEVYSYSDRFGESPQGSQISVTLGDVIMAAPTNFTYNINNGNDIALTWNSMENAASYKIYLISNGQKTLKSTVTGTSMTYTNMPAGSYNYEIHSYSTSFGESTEGNKVSFTLAFPIMEPPANLVHTIKSATDFTLSWDVSSYATSYKVYQIVNGTKILKSTVSGTSVTYTNMSPGDYNYEVHSYSTRFGESTEGSNLTMTLEGQIMQAPADLTYSTANINDITLKWSAVTYATSYKIYQVIDGQNVLKKTVTSTSATFTNMPEDDYHYIVTSVSTLLGESPIGAEITFSLDLPTMVAPGNLTYKIQNINSVVLTWSASTYANSYKVYELIDGQEILKTTVTSLTATLSNVASGEHTYVVHSVSTRFGESPEGSQISFNLEQQYMEAPTNFTYSIANMNDITLKWNAGTYATSYKIYRVIDGQKSLVKTVTTTSATFTNMPAGDYDYIVTSVSTLLGESLSGSEVTFSLDLPTMISPANLAYNIQNGNSVVLTWEASTYANSYKVYELIDGQEVLKTTVTSLTATLSNVEAGDHTYVVHSVSTRFGESSEGSQISFNLQQYYMVAPANLTYSTANINDIILKWTASTYATSYKIYRVIDGQKSLVKTVTTTSATFTNMPEDDYDYIVTSVSTLFGESPNESEVTFSLDLPTIIAPSNLTQTITNGNYITLKWNASTYATAYNIYQIINGEKTLIKTVTSTSVTFANMPEGDYSYEVNSYSNRLGESETGSIINFTLNWPVVQPPLLTDSIYNVNNVTLSWQAVTWANEYSVFEVTNGTRELLYKGTALSYKAFNLSEGTHSYEVNAYSTRFGESDPSNTITETIIYPDMQSPVASLKLIDSTTAVISWNFITYANGYNIYEIIDGKPVLLTKNLNNLSYTVSNLSYKDHQYYVTSVSNSFGQSQPSNTVIAKLIVDTEAPKTVSDAPINWVNQSPVAVHLSATDNETGVANTYYSINDSDFTEGIALTIDKEGENKISFYSVDKAGNKEEVQTSYVNIDKTAPVTTSNATTDWMNKDGTINLTAIDAESGVSKTFHSINDSDFTEGNIIMLDKEGENKISFYSVDKAGNKEEVQTSYVNIDKTAPVTTSNATEGWMNKDGTINLTATDAESGVSKTFYSVNDSDFTEGNIITLDKEGENKISFYSIDKAGNKEVVQTTYVKIDKTAPVVTMDLSNQYKLGTTLPLSYIAMDNLSGIASEKMVVFAPNETTGTNVENNGSLQINRPGIYKVYVVVTDAAGNSTTIEKQFLVYIPAIIEVTPTIIKGNNGVFTVRVNAPTEYSKQGFDLNTATLNGVKALISNNGYYNQAKLGQFKFERSDFNWTPSDMKVEFRGYINGNLVVGETIVKVQK